MEFLRVGINDFHKVPPHNGIYSWHLAVNKLDAIGAYCDLFQSRTFNASIKGSLSETYTGMLHGDMKKINIPDQDQLSDSTDDLLKTATLEFSPPLYIGISKNLNLRLSVHRDQLNSHYSGPDDESFLSEEEPIRSDTDLESSHFGIRASKFLRVNKEISVSNLYVKLVYSEHEITRPSLLLVERVLNRTYFPRLGRN